MWYYWRVQYEVFLNEDVEHSCGFHNVRESIRVSLTILSLARPVRRTYLDIDWPTKLNEDKRKVPSSLLLGYLNLNVIYLCLYGHTIPTNHSNIWNWYCTRKITYFVQTSTLCQQSKINKQWDIWTQSVSVYIWVYTVTT